MAICYLLHSIVMDFKLFMVFENVHIRVWVGQSFAYIFLILLLSCGQSAHRKYLWASLVNHYRQKVSLYLSLFALINFVTMKLTETLQFTVFLTQYDVGFLIDACLQSLFTETSSSQFRNWDILQGQFTFRVNFAVS